MAKLELRSGVARPVRGRSRAHLLCLNIDREASARHQLPWTVQAQLGLKVRCRRAVLVLEMSALVRAASVIYTFGLGDGPTARRASAPLIAGAMEGAALASDADKRGVDRPRLG